MLNEERIKLMTKMAAYEGHEGKKNLAIGRFFRSDYISLQVIKSIISGTIAFAIGFGVFIFYDFEIYMQDMYKIDLLEFGKELLISYLIFVGIYSVISYVVYTYRYNKAKKSLKIYFGNLKHLMKLYERDGR